MIDTVSGKLLRKYTILTGIFFLALFLYYIFGYQTNGILEFQAMALVLGLCAIIIGSKCKNLSQVLIIILVFQFFSLVGMSFFDPAEEIGDKENYEAGVREMLKMRSFSDVIKPITNPEITSDGDISDMGYSIPLYLCVYLFGWDAGMIVMGILKLLCHVLSVIIIYKLSCNYIGERNAQLVALIWGLNMNNSFFILAGLKESLFVIAVLYAVSRLYSQIQKPCLSNLVLFVFASFLTILFRAVFPAFFILTYIGYLVFFNIESKSIRYILVTMSVAFSFYVVILIFSSSFESILIRMEEDEEFTKVPIYLKILNGFIAPYPCLRIDGAKSNLMVAAYSVIHSSFSVFAVLGMFYVIKKKIKELFPILGVLCLNIAMLVITGFSMNVRFLYPTHILYYVFIPIGLAYYYKRVYYVPYLLLLFVIVMKYNQIM